MGIQFPYTDDGLLAWSLNFSTKINLDPPALGLTSVQSAAYQTLHELFGAKLKLVAPGVRNQVAVAEKNEVRDDLKDRARALARIIDGANVSNPTKIDLGMTVRSMPTRIPVPAFSPTVEITSVVGHTVSVRIHGPNPTRRGLSDGCDGIAVFSFAGEICPTDPSKFSFEANTTKMQFDIQFPESVVPGTTVWITAMFFNERKQSGVAANPISTKINFGGMQQTA